MTRNSETLLERSFGESETVRMIEVRVPGSTSNLGAGFDCFGLALALYLNVRVTVLDGASEPFRVRSLGAGEDTLPPRSAENLIHRSMRFIAEREDLPLPPFRMAVRNEIPIGKGLGSSAAAIVAGLTLGAAVSGRELTPAALLRYAAELEGHADNAAASLMGGWVTTGMKDDGEVMAVRRRWVREIKVMVVSPHLVLETTRARAALPSQVDREHAVYNLQRAALFGAALESGDDDLLWESMRDRLHQPHRAALVPGLASALATPRRPGLVGLALSGSGPSVVALVRDNFDEIGEAIASGFREEGIEATIRLLEVDETGHCVNLVSKA